MLKDAKTLPPYKKAIPINMRPVENAPIRKYFNEASFPRRLFLSLPVRTYRGIDIISIPRKSISNVLNEELTETPHSTKNMSAKYSETLEPTFSISLPFKRKYNKVQANAIVLNNKPNLSNFNIDPTSTLNIEYPKNSATLATSTTKIPAVAQYLGTDEFLNSTPPNIITTPHIAVRIIAFILGSSHLF
jgi:hypothetical protein